jgi:mRNA interferase RelE/StbE
MSYKIEFTQAAERGLRGMPERDRSRIARRIDALGENPRPMGVRKLSGAENQYRIRIGDYRVIYAIEDQLLTVLVIRVGNRRDIYR